MAKEKSQRKRGKVQELGTPKRVTKQEMAVIGSSSTWNQDELHLFRVKVIGDVDVREMIPDKFFDFSALQNYITGTAVSALFG